MKKVLFTSICIQPWQHIVLSVLFAVVAAPAAMAETPTGNYLGKHMPEFIEPTFRGAATEEQIERARQLLEKEAAEKAKKEAEELALREAAEQEARLKQLAEKHPELSKPTPHASAPHQATVFGGPESAPQAPASTTTRTPETENKIVEGKKKARLARDMAKGFFIGWIKNRCFEKAEECTGIDLDIEAQAWEWVLDPFARVRAVCQKGIKKLYEYVANSYALVMDLQAIHRGFGCNLTFDPSGFDEIGPLAENPNITAVSNR